MVTSRPRPHGRCPVLVCTCVYWRVLRCSLRILVVTSRPRPCPQNNAPRPTCNTTLPPHTHTHTDTHTHTPRPPSGRGCVMSWPLRSAAAVCSASIPVYAQKRRDLYRVQSAAPTLACCAAQHNTLCCAATCDRPRCSHACHVRDVGLPLRAHARTHARTHAPAWKRSRVCKDVGWSARFAAVPLVCASARK